MAQTDITIHYLAANAGQADPAGVASTPGAGNEFIVAPDGIDHRNVFLRVQNLAASAATVSVLAGAVQADAISAGQGNVTYSVPATSTAWLGPFDSSRVGQPDGSLLIQTSAALTVTVFNIDNRYV